MLRLRSYEQALAQLLLLTYAGVVLYPFVIVLFSSMKPLGEVYNNPFGPPRIIHLENYLQAWRQAAFAVYFRNSLIVSTAAVILLLLLASMAAYVLARYRFRGGVFISLLFLAGLSLPQRLAIVPLFVLMRDLHLLDSLIGLVLIYAAGGLPFAIFLMASFFRTIPGEIEDAARIDGCTPFQAYWRVMVPLVRPALATVGIFNFVSVWNDFFFPLIFIRSAALRTIPLGLSLFFGEYSIQWHLLFAALLIAMVPTIVVFLLFSRQFIQGVMAGAFR